MNLIFKTLSSRFDQIIELIYPTRCPSCFEILEWGNSDFLCLDCATDFYSLSEAVEGCPMVKDHTWGRTGIRNTYAHLGFSADGKAQKVVHQIKYGGQKALARHWGQMMGCSLNNLPWFESVDALVPIPIHWRRKFQRGYNQSTCLSQGIQDVTDKLLDHTSVTRSRYTRTQTGMNRQERLHNLSSCMRAQKFDEAVRHVLLVDDVMTTGATLEWTCRCISEVNPEVKQSVAVLGIGGL